MFSSNFTDLLQILEMDKNKLLHFGPPRFRINIPCKYGNQCKYGRSSCEYSHESLCRFLKKGGKCLNINCTHQHEFPFEYQLAQELLNLQMQLSQVPESFEARKSTSAHHFSTQTRPANGTSGTQEFRFKVNDSPIKSTENNLKTTEINLSQSPTKAESPLQHSVLYSNIQPTQENLQQTIQNSYLAQNLLKHIQKWAEIHLQSTSLVLQMRKNH